MEDAGLGARGWGLVQVISSFRDLRVWQQGMDIVEQIYGVSRDFPKHEIYGLSSQMRRAAVSIPALHHHFEALGWQESKIIARFWIAGLVMALFALTTLKLR